VSPLAEVLLGARNLWKRVPFVSAVARDVERAARLPDDPEAARSFAAGDAHRIAVGADATVALWRGHARVGDALPAAISQPVDGLRLVAGAGLAAANRPARGWIRRDADVRALRAHRLVFLPGRSHGMPAVAGAEERRAVVELHAVLASPEVRRSDDRPRCL